MCVCSRWRLERVEQVVGVWCRLFNVEEQGVHPALTWHRGQRLPGARLPVSQLYQRAVPTEWVHYHPHTEAVLSAVQWNNRKDAVADIFNHFPATGSVECSLVIQLLIIAELMSGRWHFKINKRAQNNIWELQLVRTNFPCLFLKCACCAYDDNACALMNMCPTAPLCQS